MFKKTITYTDYFGEERTEDFYFNLNQAEVTKMEASEKGGYGNLLNRISQSDDNHTLVESFSNFVMDAYGVRTSEGGFSKKREHKEAFAETQAYSDIFMELATDDEKAAEFINGVFPQNAEIKKSSGTRTAPQDRLPKQKDVPTEYDEPQDVEAAVTTVPAEELSAFEQWKADQAAQKAGGQQN